MLRTIPSLLDYTLSSGASDLFLTAGKSPRIRLYGKIQPLGSAIITQEEMEQFRNEVLHSKKLQEEYLLSGGADATCELSEDKRFRINFLQTQGVPALVARPLRNGDALFYDALHLPGELLHNLSSQPRGLILFCGAAGSGKSTSLSAIVNDINRTSQRHVILLEDPLEYLHSDINSLITQRQINTDAESFASGLRHALRESPDVIVIGEMRDRATMQSAITAALTGHLVISTLHSSDTTQALEHLLSYFPEQQRPMVAADLSRALLGVFSQRLLAKADDAGMVPAIEILSATPLVKQLIARQEFAELEEHLKLSRNPDLIPFNRAFLALVKSGQILPETARKQVSNMEEFEMLLRGMESGNDAFRNQDENHNPDIPFELDIKQLLKGAVKNNASDLLLTAGQKAIVRINGTLRTLETPILRPRDVRMLLYSILSMHQRAEFEAKKELDFALTVPIRSSENPDAPPRECRFRLNGFFQRGHVGVSARVVPDRVPTPEQLRLPAPVVQFCDRKCGLVLITGATGHGKTTTLASLLDYINHKYSYHIITIEDPVEYIQHHKLSVIEQRELYADTLSFASALKHALREDPDVIMIGELRDTETMAAALTAAETGHLVFATLHTNNAVQSIDRLVDSFPPHQQQQIRIQLASTLLGVASQRLIPRSDGQGRVAAFEVMVNIPAIAALIRDGKTSQLTSVLETNFRDGMITMDRSLDELYGQGLISREEYDSLRRNYRTVKEY